MPETWIQYDPIDDTVKVLMSTDEEGIMETAVIELDELDNRSLATLANVLTTELMNRMEN